VKHFFREIGNFSVSGFWHYLLLRLRGKTILVAGACRGCGTCCRRISLEGPDGWLRSESTYYTLLRRNPEYQRFALIGKDEQGFLLFSCTWLNEHGACRDHDNRLRLCRRFPESSLLFAGGRLPPGCGYRFVATEPFAKVLQRAKQERDGETGSRS
jgi:uncharacterized cysteine cluster protein YcgN (CxxCxxCC family)